MKFTSDPCGACGHRGTATYGKTDEHGEPIGVQWDAPPADCACRCHDAWRIFHRTPAVAA